MGGSCGQPIKGVLAYLSPGPEATDLLIGLLTEALHFLTGSLQHNLLLPHFSLLFFQHGHFLLELSQLFQEMAVENAEPPPRNE